MIRRIKSSPSLPKRFKSTYLSLQRKKRPVTKFHWEKSEVSISLRENSQINEISFQLQTLVEPEREIFHQKSTKEMEGGRLVAVDFLFRGGGNVFLRKIAGEKFGTNDGTVKLTA